MERKILINRKKTSYHDLLVGADDLQLRAVWRVSSPHSLDEPECGMGFG